jgi:hypothetical protein
MQYFPDLEMNLKKEDAYKRGFQVLMDSQCAARENSDRHAQRAFKCLRQLEKTVRSRGSAADPSFQSLMITVFPFQERSSTKLPSSDYCWDVRVFHTPVIVETQIPTCQSDQIVS